MGSSVTALYIFACYNLYVAASHALTTVIATREYELLVTILYILLAHMVSDWMLSTSS